MQTLANPRSQLSKQFSSHPLKLVALGDSLVYGFGDPVGGGWVEQLRLRWMSPPGHVLYNLGVRGDGVQQVQARLEQEFCHRGELRNRVPEAMILSVGVNDSARLGHVNGRQYTDFDLFNREMATLLDQSQQLCSVLFVGMVPVDEEKMPFLGSFYYNHGEQYRYKEATRLACEKRQIPYLDIFDLWMARGTQWRRDRLSADGLHPNVSGYQALLQDVLAWEPIAKLASIKSSAA
ncbi:MAG: G-D-S-L family lipolytic protein [Kastovskya adunca ATA6-11-RM4]|jgi:lysophospholipase L1-like esterase|nr:G-D-S-L family lipolytic protein [Kastovskya adunca ATA6-11-RM4]